MKATIERDRTSASRRAWRRLREQLQVAQITEAQKLADAIRADLEELFPSKGAK